MIKTIRSELEILKGSLIRGDATPIVYDLIKDSPFIEDILEYSTISKGEKENVHKKRSVGDASINSGSGSAFEDWFKNEVQPISIHGARKTRFK